MAPVTIQYESPDEDPEFADYSESSEEGVFPTTEVDGGPACVCHRHRRGKGHVGTHHCKHELD